MSILPPIAALLLAEHKRRPISGNILLIGRQSVPMTFSQVADLIVEAGVPFSEGRFEERDSATTGAHPEHLTDRSFFSLFCDGNVKALDVSGYEGAEIIHNLNDELPSTLHRISDFLFDGSCLDNLFDPARALRSFSKMLRPNGRMFCFEHGTPIQSAFVCLTPEWFASYFAANKYEYDVRPYSFDSILDPAWTPGRQDRKDFVVVAMADKTDRATDDVMPIQAHYAAIH